MSSDTTQLIKDKLDIVDFLKQYIELKPSGKNYKANCPFHKEKTPSFMVSPERQSWHCFGSCSEGGDIIKFLMKYENLEFYDALKVLAEKAGVEIQTSGDRDFKSYNSLYKVMEAAKDFFKANLNASPKVLAYLKERGLKEETIKEFELGLAPDTSDSLTKHLLKLGYNILDIERAGLALKTERGTYWDRFRSRAMFPIYNHFGKVVAFTGRILPGNDNPNVGKYVNSPETPIFQKSKILYGFSKTKNDIRDAGVAVIVEGQMDFLMMWQDGIKNVVASSGTALTADHLKVLRRLADELIFSFDADEAGEHASERAIDLAGENDFSVRLLIIEDPKLKDPADIVKHKPGMAKELIDKSKIAMEYFFHKYLKNKNLDLKSKKNNLRIVLGKIKSLASPIDRGHWLKELAHLAKIDEQVLSEEMEMMAVKSLIRNLESKTSVEVEEKLSRRELISQRLFGILLHIKDDLKVLEEHLKYFPEQYHSLYKNFLSKEVKDAKNELSDLMSAISLRFSFENQNIDKEDLQKETKNLLRELKIEYLKEKCQEVSELIRRLEIDGDEKSLEKAMLEYSILSKELEMSKSKL
ncbi:MAG: DNA primase [bacterium]|nr:DNA primase [bacterium]